MLTTVAASARALGSHAVLAPVLDLFVDPRFGRLQEGFGEDPMHVAAFARAAAIGLQGAPPADDAGGGVIWAPQVIEDARDHGLVLSEKGKLYDTKAGQTLPDGVKPMPLLTAAELAQFPELSPMQVVGMGVRRYWDMVALAGSKPVKVIGERGIIRDKPGFEVDFITRGSASEDMHSHDRPSVLMPVTGHWRVTWDGGSTALAPGDTMSVPAGVAHCAVPSMSGEAGLYHIIATDDPAGPTWMPT